MARASLRARGIVHAHSPRLKAASPRLRHRRGGYNCGDDETPVLFAGNTMHPQRSEWGRAGGFQGAVGGHCSRITVTSPVTGSIFLTGDAAPCDP